jgi:nitrate/nitrite transport system permease protein
MTFSLRFRAAVVSIVLFAAFLGIWHLATRGSGAVQQMDPEYAKLMGLTATQGKSAMPGPLDVGAKLWEHLRRPFYDNGPNDKGLGIQLGFSIALFAAFLGIWHLATRSTAATTTMSPEYAKLMGLTATQGKSAMPGPLDVGAKLWEHLRRPFYDNGPNDKGLGIQLGYSIARVALGYFLAVIVAIPLGFLIGMSPLINKALDPFIQVLKPISPLAWMPLALYTIKDSSLSAIFVIFICSLWPMMINTAFGVASVRKEWLNVAKTLEVGTFRQAFTVILPAAAPTILTGMRISIGIAWLVIVAAEMLVGGTGIGYFVWNEWNNLSITNVIIAILVIGLVCMVLDQLLARVSRIVSFPV